MVEMKNFPVRRSKVNFGFSLRQVSGSGMISKTVHFGDARQFLSSRSTQQRDHDGPPPLQRPSTGRPQQRLRYAGLAGDKQRIEALFDLIRLTIGLIPLPAPPGGAPGDPDKPPQPARGVAAHPARTS